MVKPELVDQIKSQLRLGTDKETIISSLTINGFEKQDIEDSFIAAAAEQATAVLSDTAEAESVICATSSVSYAGDSKIKVKELFKKSWELYKSRWKTFLGVTLAPTFIGFVIGIFFLLSGAFSWINPQNLQGPSMTSFFFLMAALFIPMMILQLWEQAALVYAIKGSEEKIGVVESYRRGWTKVGAFLWVSILSFFIICGGSLLLIIPGIIISVWFTFASYIIIDEDLRGMDALLKSREYIRGRGWQLFWLIFGLLPYMILAAIVLGIASLIFMGFLYLLIPDGTISDIKAMMSQNANTEYRVDFSFLLAPLITAYTYYIYLIFKQDKGEFVFAPTAGTKNKYKLLALLGVLFIVMIVGLMVAFL